MLLEILVQYLGITVFTLQGWFLASGNYNKPSRSLLYSTAYIPYADAYMYTNGEVDKYFAHPSISTTYTSSAACYV